MSTFQQLSMNVHGLVVGQGQVGTLMVVEPDGFGGGGGGMNNIGQRVAQAILQLEDTIDSLGLGIVVAVADLPHAGETADLSQAVAVGGTGVLDAMVAVLNEASQRRLGLSNGHVQCPQRPFDGQGGGDIKADDEAGEGIGDQAEIAKAVGLGCQVGDVTDPDLLHPVDKQVVQPIGATPATRPGCPSSLAGDGQEQVMTSQQVEEAVAPQVDTGLGQQGLQFVPQLAASHARMTLPPGQHPLDSDGLRLAGRSLALYLLVVGLPTNAVPTTYRAHCDSLPGLLGSLDDGQPPFFLRSIPS